MLPPCRALLQDCCGQPVNGRERRGRSIGFVTQSSMPASRQRARFIRDIGGQRPTGVRLPVPASRSRRRFRVASTPSSTGMLMSIRERDRRNVRKAASTPSRRRRRIRRGDRTVQHLGDDLLVCLVVFSHENRNAGRVEDLAWLFRRWRDRAGRVRGRLRPISNQKTLPVLRRWTGRCGRRAPRRVAVRSRDRGQSRRNVGGYCRRLARTGRKSALSPVR